MTAIPGKLNTFGIAANNPAFPASKRLNTRQRLVVRLASRLRINAETPSHDFRNLETQRMYLSVHQNIL